jgi:arylsulfatase
MDWDGLPAERQAQLVRSMEVYAAMVESMDANIGRLIAHLDETERRDNTFIFFMSDNGADGTDLLGPVELRGLDVPDELRINNALDNVGKADSFVAYGADWAKAAMAPSRLVKGHVWTGGVHSPAFIAGPGVEPGVSGAFAHVLDIAATVVALAAGEGATPPEEFDGRSLLPVLADPTAEVRGPDDVVAWEQSYARAIRMGDWRAVFATPAVPWIFAADDSAVAWRLYNVAEDPGETRDLAADEPQRLAAMVAAWRAWADRVGVYVPPQLEGSLHVAAGD